MWPTSWILLGLKAWVLGRCLNSHSTDLPWLWARLLLHSLSLRFNLALMPLKYLQNVSHTLLDVVIRPVSSAHLGFVHKFLCPSPDFPLNPVVLSQSLVLPEDSEAKPILSAPWSLREEPILSAPWRLREEPVLSALWRLGEEPVLTTGRWGTQAVKPSHGGLMCLWIRKTK